ncbi:MAG: hypothetical protein OEY28_07630 [Nitrospira sp.]|nr:hypothetical protein [Nitrospira sp.]
MDAKFFGFVRGGRPNLAAQDAGHAARTADVLSLSAFAEGAAFRVIQRIYADRE